jgi:hypothetical protein
VIGTGANGPDTGSDDWDSAGPDGP